MTRRHLAALALCLTLAGTAVSGEQTNVLDLNVSPAQVRRGHLDLGGTSVDGTKVEVNSHYIEVDGKPFIPIVGEIHYSRYPAAYWDEAIRKMKAGGINVIATYVFWNMHERTEGVFDWTGNLNLRHFIELCERHRVWAIVRMGPFCHGEIRNGGIPDWIYGRPVEIRSNDPGYLAYADRLYGQIARQLQGKLFKDGGPVIGVQLENEFQHSAAPWEVTYPGARREFTVADRDVDVTHIQITAGQKHNPYAAEGRDHMATLKRLAQKHGIHVPIYTATGWGNASIVERGSIPVTAGYPYPFWAPRRASAFYLYKDIRHEPDYSPVSFDTDAYPSMPAELGAGISVTYGRRPVVPPESLAPLIVRTLGSGSNGIGYYMYHGGSNPVIDGHYFNEYSGGLPRINYDYQAPIGEFGQTRSSHRSLRLLHHFLRSYGDVLAPMRTILPANAAGLKPEDVTTLRYAVRALGNRGFVFLHNFQDHVETRDLTEQRVQLSHENGDISIPRHGMFTLRTGTSAILPFNLDLDGTLLRAATVQPLTVLRRPEGVHRVFVSFDGIAPELVFAGTRSFIGKEVSIALEGDVTIVRGPAGRAFHFSEGDRQYLVLPYDQAQNALQTNDQHLILAEADLFPGTTGIEVRSIGRAQLDLHVYPATASTLRLSRGQVEPLAGTDAGLAGWRLSFEPVVPKVTATRSGPRRVVVSMRHGLQGASDLWMNVPYVGDRVLAFIGGELVADHFYQGIPWTIGLRKFEQKLAQEDLVFVFHGAEASASWLQDLPPEARAPFAEAKKPFLRIDEFSFSPEYRCILTLAE